MIEKWFGAFVVLRLEGGFEWDCSLTTHMCMYYGCLTAYAGVEIYGCSVCPRLGIEIELCLGGGEITCDEVTSFEWDGGMVYHKSIQWWEEDALWEERDLYVARGGFEAWQWQRMTKTDYWWGARDIHLPSATILATERKSLTEMQARAEAAMHA